MKPENRKVLRPCIRDLFDFSVSRGTKRKKQMSFKKTGFVRILSSGLGNA